MGHVMVTKESTPKEMATKFSKTVCAYPTMAVRQVVKGALRHYKKELDSTDSHDSAKLKASKYIDFNMVKASQAEEVEEPENRDA